MTNKQHIPKHWIPPKVCPECHGTGFSRNVPTPYYPCPRGCKPETKPQQSPTSGGDSSPEAPERTSFISPKLVSSGGVPVRVTKAGEWPEQVILCNANEAMIVKPGQVEDWRCDRKYIRADLHRAEVERLERELDEARADLETLGLGLGVHPEIQKELRRIEEGLEKLEGPGYDMGLDSETGEHLGEMPMIPKEDALRLVRGEEKS